MLKLFRRETSEKQSARREKRNARREQVQKSLALTLQTTTKQLIWWFTIHGTIWIYCSYYLALTNHEQIAESLSSNVCTVVIGSMGMYVISKTIENVFKYNTIGGDSNEKALEREGMHADPASMGTGDVPFIDMTNGMESNGVPEDVPDTIIVDEPGPATTDASADFTVDPSILD